MGNQFAREDLDEERFQAGLARRRSRSAANFNAARILPSVNSGKSTMICSLDIPAARYEVARHTKNLAVVHHDTYYPDPGNRCQTYPHFIIRHLTHQVRG